MRGSFDRLPKYAQREIERLRADLAYAQEKLAAGPEDSRVIANPHSDAPTPLGDADVRFLGLADEHGRRPHFTVRIRTHGVLEVHGSASFQVQPQSSNVVAIKIGDYF